MTVEPRSAKSLVQYAPRRLEKSTTRTSRIIVMNREPKAVPSQRRPADRSDARGSSRESRSASSPAAGGGSLRNYQESRDSLWEVQSMAIERVGIVGFGLMGSGIAQVCATAGVNVVVREVEQRF